MLSIANERKEKGFLIAAVRNLLDITAQKT